MIVVLAGVVLLLGLDACGGTSSPRYVSMTSATGQPELLMVPGNAHVRGLVLFMHGFAADQRQLLTMSGFAPTRKALLSAGYAIAASSAHGDNSGSPTSVQDQVNVLADARQRIQVDSVFILGFSMGGLDALEGAASHRLSGLRAVALISPVCDIRPYIGKPRFDNQIRTAFDVPASEDLAAAIRPYNPMTIPTARYAGLRYVFWQSPDDQAVVKAEQADAMVAKLRAASIPAQEHALTGGHADVSALRPVDLVKFYRATN